MTSVRLLLATLTLLTLAGAACEKSNEAIIQEQLRDATCPKGCADPIPGCNIKGNIGGTGQKFYLLPEHELYKDVIIQPEKGERWFCTPQEAERNGFRTAPP
jgi:hypothetical protein